MRSAVIVRLIIAAGLILLFVWIANNTYWGEISLPEPLKGEAATNPFYSAQRLAESLGAHSRWQRVLGALPAPDAVIVASSWHWSLIASRRDRLERWVSAGGRLVLDRSLIGGEDELERWTGITRSYADDEENQRTVARHADRPCPTLKVGGEEPVGGPLRPRLLLCRADLTSWFTTDKKISWALRDDQNHIQALRVHVGRGSVTMINTRPFGNQELLEGDHGLLFAAATQLRRGDDVSFLSEEHGASLLSLMWSQGAPVVLIALALVALWIWRSSARFGPLAAPPDPARRSLAEQIRGTGQFTVRFGGGRALHAAAVRALNEAADRHIAHHARLQGEERITTIARMTGLGASQLSEAIKYSGPRRAGELRNTIVLLETARRLLTNTKKRRDGSGHAD
jgi:hypothetical protein